MSLIDEVERYRTDIVTDTYSTTWREVLGQYKDGDLKIDPEYQRLFRWTLDQQTQYVESLLLNIPSPPLFFARNKDGKFEVLDGLQRISTVIRLFASEIFQDEAELGEEDQEGERNNIRVPLTLSEGPIIRALEGFTAKTLPEPLIRTVRYARITIFLVEKESSPRARYEVFKRLNKQGSSLSDQEIRNCSARLFGKEFPDRLRQVATNPEIQAALSLSPEEERRMGVEERVLRLLAFSHGKNEFKHGLSEYLDEFMLEASEGKVKITDENFDRATRTFQLLNAACPNGEAFKFSRGFSSTLFDVVATGVYANLERLRADGVASLIREMKEREELRELTGPGSNTKRKTQGRLEFGRRWFSQQ